LVVLLLEVGVGTADEGVRVLELAVEIFSFLHMLNLNVHGETLGYEVQLVAKSFPQHAAVAFDLFDPHFEPVIDCLEPVIYLVESPINSLQPLIQPMNKPAKSSIEVLYELLLHTASAVK